MNDACYELLLKLGALLPRISNMVLPPSSLENFCGSHISHYLSSFSFTVLYSLSTLYSYHSYSCSSNNKLTRSSSKSVILILLIYLFVCLFIYLLFNFIYFLMYLGKTKSRVYEPIRHIFSV